MKETGGYRVRKELREVVLFAPHNLFTDPPFSRMDLIACRNVLIYIQRDVQDDIIDLFHYALRHDGYLILGTSETVDGSDLFRLEDKKACLYQKRNVPAPEPRLPVFPLTRTRLPGDSERAERSGEPVAYGALHQRMLERYAPPSALISSDDKVLHLSPHAGRFLLHPGGEVTSSIFRLIRDELRIELRSLLHEVRDTKQPRTSKPVLVRFNGETAPVVIHARPSEELNQDGFVLVMFEERMQPVSTVEKPESIKGTSVGKVDKARSRTRERELEAELELTKQRLQAIIEEYETSQEEMKASNEEMQSTNEELRSTMEELETSKEELQSMNEELQTVNQENRHKVAELAQLSSDLQNLLTATQIATLFLDRDIRILRFTPKVGELFNIRLTDRSRPITDLTHRLGYDQLELDARRVLKELIPIEREVEDEAGNWYLTRVMPYRSGEDRIEGIVITFVDITGRKKMEETLREGEQRLEQELAAMRRLHELVSGLLVSQDLNSALEQVLSAAMDITKAEKGDIQTFDSESNTLNLVSHKGFNKGFIDRYCAVSINAETVCARAALNRKRVIIEDLQEMEGYDELRAAGAEAGFRALQSTPLMSRGGELLGVLSTHYAQPQVPSERDLRMLDLYARQAADFIERVRDAEAARIADQRKDEFLATLAHELRNPLAPICMGLELMKLSDNKAETYGEVGETLQRQTRQLTTLVDDLLDVSRITRGKVDLKIATVELGDALQTAVEASRPFIDELGHSFTLSVPDSPIYLSADPNRLAQIISNLLNNAAKYTNPKGQIWLTVAKTNSEVLITVKDTGIGIPPEMLDRVFEMFSQIDRPKERGGTGLGIGLTLVKSLVEMHGGTIKAHSDGSNRGSEFTIRLPAMSEPLSPATAELINNDGFDSKARHRILVVDDNNDAARVLSLLIRKMGHEVRIAADGQEALQIAADFRPAMILMDLGMPQMNGFEAAQEVRKHEWGKQVELVALTGWGQDEDRHRTQDAGFDHHLVKPADPQELRRLFARLN